MGPNLVVRPVGEGIELHARAVLFREFDRRARGTLRPPEASYPRIHALEGAPEGLQFSHAAAPMPRVQRVHEAVHSLAAHEGLHADCVWKYTFYTQSIPSFQGLVKLVGGLGQPPRIEDENANRGAALPGKFRCRTHQNHVFGA